MVIRPSSIAFVGDVTLLSGTVQIDQGFPLLVGNLEGPIGREGPPAPGKVNLWSEETSFSNRLAPHLRAVSLANNHVLDFGAQQLLSSLKQLSDHGIAYYGLSTDDNPTGRAVIEVHGRSLGLAGYACPTTHAVFDETAAGAVRRLELHRVLEDIDALRSSGVDWIVITPHWGVEQVERPRPEDVRAARAMIDRGATGVIGHHAHCIQGYELYKDRMIAYGLGSTIWPDMDIPSEYDGEGTPASRFQRRQRRWNRRALIASLDLESGTFEMTETRFDSGKLSRGTGSVTRWDFTQQADRLLDEELFERVAFRHLLRDRMASAWQRGTLWRALSPRRVSGLFGDMIRTVKGGED